MKDLLKNLNPQQKEAVLYKDGPLLVVAGAGAGKTMVITHRIANLIKNSVKPNQILAVTFTNKAAKEMKERVFQLLKSDFDSSPAIGTFHAICLRILKENGRKVGLPQNFSILNSDESLKTIKNCQKELEINPKQFSPKKILGIISKQKSNLVKLEDYQQKAGVKFFPKIVASIWEKYEESLVKQKTADFDDLISKTVYLFEDHPKVLEKYQNRWKYILVDEYQDTNHSQYVLTKLLAQKYKNICAVGDEDQSIYSFRGANFGNILNFEKDWPNTKIIMLEQNYRSSQTILEAANAIIEKNKMRKPKNLFSEIKEGDNLTIFDAQNEKEEAEFIAKTSFKLIEDGLQPSKISVLYRANFQSRVLEEAFITRGIPYQVIGTRFFERKEIKDIVAYVKAAINPDDVVSLERIINEPSRGLGKTSLLTYIAGNPLPPARAAKMKDFLDFLKSTEKILQQKPLSEALKFIINNSGYKKTLNPKTEEDLARIDNLNELLVLSKKYDTLDPETGVERFLEDVSLISDQDEIKDDNKKIRGSVRLMTVHAAKGLEFPYVFIVGLEDGLFPYIKGLSFGRDEEEEERRLFYVALTRAKEKLHLSFSYSRNLFGGRQINKPSRFINDIPQELFEETFDEVTITNFLDF